MAAADGDKIRVQIAGETQDIAAMTTGLDLWGKDRTIVAMVVNGQPWDLARTLPEDAQVEPITADSQAGLEIIRHSATHVLAQAVQQVYPDANLGVGPYITDGFYYDFGNIDPVTPELLKDLEKRMKKIVKSGQRFVRREVSDEEAKAELADQPYKLELIDTKGTASSETDGANVEVGAGQLTIYDNIDRNGQCAWKDLCRGPHVPNTRYIGNGFALMKSSAAYWKGDQSGDHLQRIYGTAWASKDDLVAYQTCLKEAERRDHRKLGRELDLFSFPDEIGSGLPVLPQTPYRGRIFFRIHPPYH